MRSDNAINLKFLNGSTLIVAWKNLKKNIRIIKININANTITSQEGNNNSNNNNNNKKNNNQQPEQRKPNGHKEQQSKKKEDRATGNGA